MATLLDYKCPNCGGAIHYDSGSGQMKCPFCGAEFDLDALQAYDDAVNAAPDSDMQWGDAGEAWDAGEAEGLRVYSCNSCGGEIVGDDAMGATKCPFCDNPVVMTGQFSGALKPNCVIPFKLDKKAAKAGLEKHLQGKRLLPKVFRDQNHIDEIKGVYVPFWLFDADAQAFIRYKCTKIRRWSDSQYNYKETSHFAVMRGGFLGFDRVPADGSTKMADDLMESIEPFDFKDAAEFKAAYLAGYMADKYDVTAAECEPRANERIKKSTEEAFRKTVTGYDSVTAEGSSVNLQNGRVSYALYPVWLLNTTWQGKQYTFAMNGQTGKFVGDLPMDKGAFARWLAILTGACSAAAYGLLFLLHLAGLF